MRVLITGGAGFIGANLARHLSRSVDGTRVVVLDDLSTGRAANLDGVDAELVEGSILDRATVATLVGDADAVVHLAARPSVPRSIEDPVASYRVNVDGTLEVLEAVRTHGQPHLILASSSSVYGDNPELPKHVGLAPRPRSPYAASKLAGESMALAHASSFGLDVLVFRFFNVFGPLQAADHAYAAVVPAFVSAALSGRAVTVHGDGRQTRDFTYVDTVCEVISSALARRVGEAAPMNLAFGTRTDLLSVLDILEGVLGHEIAREFTEPRAGDVPDSQADDGPVRARFAEVDPVSLTEGLTRTVAWFRTTM